MIKTVLILAGSIIGAFVDFYRDKVLKNVIIGNSILLHQLMYN